MIEAIVSFLVYWITYIIGLTGYAGIFLLMLLESAGAPIPSEIIMPFSGFLIVSGKLNFWLVVLIGASANLIGSIFAYLGGVWGGRPMLEKWGKYLLISRRDLDLADRWFKKHGELTVFFSRLVPLLRTFISFPAGVAKMNFKKFCVYTFLGALPWVWLFTWLGVKMGENWELIRKKIETFDIFILAIAVLIVVWYIRRHLKNIKKINPKY